MTTDPDATSLDPPAPPRSAEAKLALRQANRSRLDQDLMFGRLRFASLPRVVEYQLSNFCNMSCTMCYDGNNPPMQRAREEVVERFAAEVLPTASVLSPFVGSEPLIVTWDLARRLAETYRVELDIITNAQFLDEAKFQELEPLVSSVTFSIDSHLRDVYERIRLRSRPDKVFANLPRAVELCRAHGIEPQANVVLMVENAPFLDETVAYLADLGCTTVRILAFHLPDGVGPDRGYSDAIAHLSPQWISWMLGKLRAIAREKRILLAFEGAERFVEDHRPGDLRFRDNGKAHLSPWNELPYFFPGYCVQSVDHIKVQADGSAYPCCVAGGDTLRLGNVATQSFDEVWNGKEARDLRRGMLTGDLPEVCRTCSFHTAWILPEQEHLPVVDWYHDVHASGQPRIEASGHTLAADGPAHMLRSEDPPEFRWRPSASPVDHYALVLGVGGTFHEDNLVFRIDGGATSFRIPADAWAGIRANLGMWWLLYGIDERDPSRSARTPKLRCLIRHQPLPRIEGSTLYGS